MSSSNGRNNNKTLPAPVPAQISEETLKSLLAVQSQDLSLRSKELDLRAREMEQNSAHAEKILHAQERDREAERSHQRRMSRGRLILGGVVVLILAGLIMAGMAMNKDALVKDIIQIFGSAALGALGGYGVGIRKRGAPEDSQEQ